MSHETRCAGASFDTVREALLASGQLIQPRGTDALMASCPLHTDHSPSLSVTWRASTPGGRGGAVLLHCFSCGAHAVDITAALGLRVADLFDTALPATDSARSGHTGRVRRTAASPRPTPGPLPPRVTAAPSTAEHRWRRVRIYTYTDAGGRPIQQVIRQECRCTGQAHKRFQQRYRDGRAWVYRKPAGFTPTLYRQSAVHTARNAEAWVWIAEGEKDADTLSGLEKLATTNPQGAANFSADLIAQFADLNVAIVADRDLAGYRRAITLSRQLRDTAAQIAVLLPALQVDKADLTDHVNAGLWRPAEPFGGLLTVTIRDLHALAVAASASQAAHRFDIAIAEMLAHRGAPQDTAAHARAAARWLIEAQRHLRSVRDGHQELARHAREHPSATAAQAARTATALGMRVEEAYRRATTGRDTSAPRVIATTPADCAALKEPAGPQAPTPPSHAAPPTRSPQHRVAAGSQDRPHARVSTR